MTDLTLFTGGTAPPVGAAATGVGARTCYGAGSIIAGREDSAVGLELLVERVVVLRDACG